MHTVITKLRSMLLLQRHCGFGRVIPFYTASTRAFQLWIEYKIVQERCTNPLHERCHWQTHVYLKYLDQHDATELSIH